MWGKLIEYVHAIGLYFFRMIVSLLFIHVDFQEINLLQCFDQECSSSRKFSVLHNRSVYSKQCYF